MTQQRSRGRLAQMVERLLCKHFCLNRQLSIHAAGFFQTWKLYNLWEFIASRTKVWHRVFKKCRIDSPNLPKQNTVVESETIWAKGNVAQSNWLCDVTHSGCGCMTSYISTTQHYKKQCCNLLQYQLTSLTYSGVQVLIGNRPKNKAPWKGKAPKWGNETGKNPKNREILPYREIPHPTDSSQS